MPISAIMEKHQAGEIECFDASSAAVKFCTFRHASAYKVQTLAANLKNCRHESHAAPNLKYYKNLCQKLVEEDVYILEYGILLKEVEQLVQTIFPASLKQEATLSTIKNCLKKADDYAYFQKLQAKIDRAASLIHAGNWILKALEKSVEKESLLWFEHFALAYPKRAEVFLQGPLKNRHSHFFKLKAVNRIVSKLLFPIPGFRQAFEEGLSKDQKMRLKFLLGTLDLAVSK